MVPLYIPVRICSCSLNCLPRTRTRHTFLFCCHLSLYDDSSLEIERSCVCLCLGCVSRALSQEVRRSFHPSLVSVRAGVDVRCGAVGRWGRGRGNVKRAIATSKETILRRRNYKTPTPRSPPMHLHYYRAHKKPSNTRPEKPTKQKSQVPQESSTSGPRLPKRESNCHRAERSPTHRPIIQTPIPT